MERYLDLEQDNQAKTFRKVKDGAFDVKELKEVQLGDKDEIMSSRNFQKPIRIKVRNLFLQEDD